MMRTLRVALLGLMAMAALLAWPAPVAQAATFTVDSTGDGGDFSTADGVCDTDDSSGDGPCTLRAAIEQANVSAGTDTIAFSIAGAGPHTISPGSALPTITDPVIIDGTTEPDFAGTPIVELNGSGAGAVDGLNITAGGSTVKGLVINRFGGDGIELSTSGLNTIEGNYIGTDVNGTADLGNTGHGVLVDGAPSNTIGGTTAGARNVISGNDSDGVAIQGSGGNQVRGNYIGTDTNGTADLGNTGRGVSVNGALNNTIGGTTGVTPGGPCTGACNVISGNGVTGVYMANSGATGNVVEGSYIGTDVNGTADLGNAGHGVSVNGAPGNTIGGTTAAARNVISGNNTSGVFISGSGATGNAVRGNYIGTEVNGTASLGNGKDGVWIKDATGNTIGGTTGTTAGGPCTGACNVISGNIVGVLIQGSGTTGNQVQGNYIGIDVNGTADLGNTVEGVLIVFASSNTIGGMAAGAGNVISGNDSHGIRIALNFGAGNVVQGNYIGTDANGSADVGNADDGVRIDASAGSNTIGGTVAAARNVISGNDSDGVEINGNDATGNDVRGNYIGTQVDGTSPLGNGSHGLHIANSASANTIGGPAADTGNTIAFNGGDGVYVGTGAGTGNLIDPNSIHSNTGLGIDLGTDGVDTNDTGDADTGANDLQNYPELTSVLIFGSSTKIKGTLNSTASTDFALEYFSNAACDASGNGEGETFVVSSTETTDGSGNVSFTVNVGSALPVGRFIAATATDASDNTSEFSECAEVFLDSDGDGEPDVTDVCPNDASNDIDGDGICMGSGFLSPKTGDNDNCPEVSNAGQGNADGDQWGDACETANCVSVFTLWVTPAGDGECDGFTDADESFMGTDPNDACPDDTLDDAWPVDINNDRSVDIFDVNILKPAFFSSAPGPPYDIRFDLWPDNSISIFDVNRLKPFFFLTCTP